MHAFITQDYILLHSKKRKNSFIFTIDGGERERESSRRLSTPNLGYIAFYEQKKEGHQSTEQSKNAI